MSPGSLFFEFNRLLASLRDRRQSKRALAGLRIPWSVLEHVGIRLTGTAHFRTLIDVCLSVLSGRI